MTEVGARLAGLWKARGRSRSLRFCGGCVALLCVFAVAAPQASLAAGAKGGPPNLVLIQTDDQTRAQLYATLDDGSLVMPNTLERIAARGTTFRNHYATYPLCCPSRTSLLTGLYPHNHGVLVNFAPYGYFGFRGSPSYHSNLAVWLQRAGYRTAHVGKFLNQYGEGPTASEVPPGWSTWITPITDTGARLYYGYRLNVNGALTAPIGSYESPDPADCGSAGQPACTYKADVEGQVAAAAIADMAGESAPFYLQLDLTAPHDDVVGESGPQAATRHLGRAATQTFDPLGFNEFDVEDKPAFLQRDRLDGEDVAQIQIRWRSELEALRSADDAIGRVLDSLGAAGVADTTYVIFVSDNGAFHGEHRLAAGKFLPHEPSARVPLIIAGPGIHHASVHAATANIDIAPTLLDLAGLRSRPVDGQSLVPYLEDPALRSRRPIILEGYTGTDAGITRTGPNRAPVTDYRGIVLNRLKLIHYWNRATELYDLRADPGELHNLARNRRYRPLRRFLQAALSRYGSCAGSDCRRPIRGAIPQP